MNEEEKIILKRLSRQVEENNSILRGMRSDKRWSKFFKFTYWAIIIAVGLFIWSWIEPVITGFSNTVDKAVEVQDNLSDSVESIKESSSFFTDFFSSFEK